MSDSAFLRVLAAAMVREVVGTAPSFGEVERAVSRGMSEMSNLYGGRTVFMYVPKVGTEARVRRARAIRGLWNGRNAAQLAEQFGLSERHVRRIAGDRTSSE